MEATSVLTDEELIAVIRQCIINTGENRLLAASLPQTFTPDFLHRYKELLKRGYRGKLVNFLERYPDVFLLDFSQRNQKGAGAVYVSLQSKENTEVEKCLSLAEMRCMRKANVATGWTDLQWKFMRDSFEDLRKRTIAITVFNYFADAGFPYLEQQFDGRIYGMKVERRISPFFSIVSMTFISEEEAREFVEGPLHPIRHKTFSTELKLFREETFLPCTEALVNFFERSMEANPAISGPKYPDASTSSIDEPVPVEAPVAESASPIPEVEASRRSSEDSEDDLWGLPPPVKERLDGKNLEERLQRKISEIRESCPEDDVETIRTKSGQGMQVYFSEKILGRGSFGAVFLGKIGDRPIAVKEVAASEVTEISNLDVIMPNFRAGSKCIDIVDFGKKRDKLYIGLELGVCDLMTCISEFQLSPREKNECTRSLIAGVKYLHSAQLVHRDLTPANIIVVSEHGEVKYKISDFGLSRKVDPNVGTMATRTIGEHNQPYEVLCTGPVSQGSSPITTRTDIFMLACCLYYIYSDGKASSPWGNRYEHFDRVRRKESPSLVLEMPDIPIKFALLWMLDHNDNARPTIKQVAKHPAFMSLANSLASLSNLRTKFKRDCKGTKANGYSPDPSQCMIWKCLELMITNDPIFGPLMPSWRVKVDPMILNQFPERGTVIQPKDIYALLQFLRNGAEHCTDNNVQIPRAKFLMDLRGFVDLEAENNATKLFFFHHPSVAWFHSAIYFYQRTMSSFVSGCSTK